MTETPIQVKKILSAKAQDLILQGDDILVVPASFGKPLSERSLEAAMETATLASNFSVHVVKFQPNDTIVLDRVALSGPAPLMLNY
jgi:hypothetical protein